jgi:hypothetical protein
MLAHHSYTRSSIRTAREQAVSCMAYPQTTKAMRHINMLTFENRNMVEVQVAGQHPEMRKCKANSSGDYFLIVLDLPRMCTCRL